MIKSGPKTMPVLETIYGIVRVPAPIQAAIKLNIDPDKLPGSILTTLDTLESTDAVLLTKDENLLLLWLYLMPDDLPYYYIP